MFGAGVFMLGLICALLRIGRNAFRYAAITLAIVTLVARAEPAWIIAIHRFLEISVGNRGGSASDRRLAGAGGSLKAKHRNAALLHREVIE